MHDARDTSTEGRGIDTNEEGRKLADASLCRMSPFIEQSVLTMFQALF